MPLIPEMRRYLRWWTLAFVACAGGFASLWLPLLFEGDGGVGCGGYGPLPLGLSALWSSLHELWLDLHDALGLVDHRTAIAWNLLPSSVTLVGGLLNVWTGRRLGNAIGVVAAVCVAAAAVDWAFWSFSYFMMLNCGGWTGDRALWLLWRVLPLVSYTTAAGFLIKAIRTR